MKVKKLLIKSLVVAGLFAAANATAQNSGTFDGGTWRIENNTLIISGTGAIPNYPTPWDMFNQGNPEFEHVVINEGITGIGNQSFYHCGYPILSYDIPASVASIHENAFDANNNVTDVKVHWEGDAVPLCPADKFGFNRYNDNSEVTITLWYPTGNYAYYYTHNWMDYFDEYEEYTPVNAVNTVFADNTPVSEICRFDLNGKMLDYQPKGVVFIESGKNAQGVAVSRKRFVKE
ncbi:MAG: leucine-rich repeat domain-containing protein [Prevotellaceae bacterium]|jgi:hypothetical protein|nr:leucine-rich repeat domain-containing protein [Prevotellaceae bacterium]